MTTITTLGDMMEVVQRYQLKELQMYDDEGNIWVTPIGSWIRAAQQMSPLTPLAIPMNLSVFLKDYSLDGKFIGRITGG